MPAKNGEEGRFRPITEKQEQSLPGSEQELKPTSESTKLEGSHDFVEYVPAGKLKGKKALITGGDSGIGRAVAIQFAREGADVSIVFLQDEQKDAEETKKLVEKEGRECQLIAGSLMEQEICRDAVRKHVQKFGEINVLVNNAGKQSMCKDFQEIDLDMVESVFRSNILAMFAITKSMADYSSTKGAIVSFTRSLAKNLTPKGIRVNAVAPGPVHTPLQPASRPAEQMEDFGAESQIGRPGQPSEIAPSFVFLASKDSELYYGQILHAYPLGD